MSAKRALGRFRAPDEIGAEDRAWTVVRSAYHARATTYRPQRRGRYVIALAAALALGAVALSPAGATVSRLISRALGIQHASPALSSLPAPGRLLVSGPAGTWTVAADGSTRRLGSWPQASWSPHGLYVAAANGDQLAAIDRQGVTQWALIRRGVSDPRWYSPSGYRLAYLSAGQLRVVAGDGSGDHVVASSVANAAPAWRPGHAYQLAYLTRRRTTVVRDADSGRLLWSTAAVRGVIRLAWSADGRYLLSLSARAARLYSARGALVSTIAPPRGAVVLDGGLSPDGALLALVLGSSADEVVLENPLSRHPAARRVLSGPGLGQVLWSPDGRWLLIGWPAANQWVFVRVAGLSRIAAVSHIAQQFGRGGEFPQVDGWCCTAR